MFHQKVWGTTNNKIKRQKRILKRGYGLPLRSIPLCSVFSPEVDPRPRRHPKNLPGRQTRGGRNALSLFWVVAMREAFQAGQNYPKRKSPNSVKNRSNLATENLGACFSREETCYTTHLTGRQWICCQRSSFTQPFCCFLLHLYRPDVTHLRPGDCDRSSRMWHIHGDLQTRLFCPSGGYFFFWTGCRSSSTSLCRISTGAPLRALALNALISLANLTQRSRLLPFVAVDKAQRGIHIRLREGGRASHVHICIRSIIIKE